MSAYTSIYKAPKEFKLKMQTGRKVVRRGENMPGVVPGMPGIQAVMFRKRHPFRGMDHDAFKLGSHH